MLSALSPLIRQTLLSQPPTITSSLRSCIRQFASSCSRLQQPVLPPRNPNVRDPSLTWDNLVGQTVVATVKRTPRTPEEIWQEKSTKAKWNLKDDPPANAYSGRSVKVHGGNVAEAYARLHSILQRNKVRAQLRRAERHEKKGEKRRRLRSERWRRQFAHEVRLKSIHYLGEPANIASWTSKQTQSIRGSFIMRADWEVFTARITWITRRGVFDDYTSRVVWVFASPLLAKLEVFNGPRMAAINFACSDGQYCIVLQMTNVPQYHRWSVLYTGGIPPDADRPLVYA
ncbi:putative ribosomal protein S21 [Lyophyllum shimeji]|uniref:Ribosomal protein S21 n=1 Tax=Lyophyllum shimeji TaxID=47721 RepID=A0A9P3PGF2_LYOSH|nr:putative ribosomal protein S21 [Lyophyllum shimeji]